MAEKVNELHLERDYKTYLYFIDGEGNVCRKAKGKNDDAKNEVVVKNAVQRDNSYLYFIDKDGDVARSKRAVRGSKSAA